MFLPRQGSICSFADAVNARFSSITGSQSRELWCLKRRVAGSLARFCFHNTPPPPPPSLISYQEVLQIVAISRHRPLSFPVARFRRCYLIGKHLKSTAGGGGREKLKRGPHFGLIYWNQYCGTFVSTNFTGRQFRLYHVCTVVLVYVSCPKSGLCILEVYK